MNDSIVLSGSETIARKVIFPKTLSVKLSLLASIASIFVLTTTSWAAGKGGGVKDALPAAPDNFIVTAVSSNQILLQWQDNSTNETGFKIERAPTPSGAWKQIATTAANVESYANTALTPSTTYYY